ncbi:MAG: hypothetical protein KAW40_01075, partial [Candidatus Aenigmarchaeota archaeon]|nr:hypothetical protein [Candidatus Aenigmarchaeota archaeon]
MRTEPEIVKEQLENLYWKGGLSVNKIANKLGCSPTKVHYWLLKYGIKRREEYKKGLNLNKEVLGELYLKQKLSLNEIAKKFDCNATNILYWLKKFSIKRRPAYRKKIHIPKETLEKLYWKRNLTTSQIAEKFGIKHGGTVLKKLKKHGIPSKTVSQALTKKFKRDFSGNLEEKAYFMGLRAGDFYAKQQHKSVRMQTTTTHLAQIELLKNAFEKYGENRVYLSKNKAREDEWFIYVDLRPSFDFLLSKPNKIPEWVLEINKYFYNFLAAYMDCEGTWNVIKSHEKHTRFIFRIKTGDKKILEQIREKLISDNYTVQLYLDSKKGRMGTYGPSRSEIYNLTLYRKGEVISLINLLLPLSK